MHARIGDRLIVEGDPGRSGLIIGVPHEDGSPPYIVRWLANGHVAMVSPGQFARIVPAERRPGRDATGHHRLESEPGASSSAT